MPRPYASGIVPGDIADVWRRVRDFDGLSSWHPEIADSEIEPGHTAGEIGAVRRLTLAGGGSVREQLLALDDAAHSYTYSMLDGPFAIRSYVSTIRLAPVTATGEVFVEWWAEYDSEGADEEQLNVTFGRGVFAKGIAALAEG